MPMIDQDLSGCVRQKCCSAVTWWLALTAHSACAGLKCQAVVLLPSLADWTRTPTGTWACNSCKAQTVEKKRKDYAFRRQFNEKPSMIPGCPGQTSIVTPQ